jgi:hypothetical protein
MSKKSKTSEWRDRRLLVSRTEEKCWVETTEESKHREGGEFCNGY